MTRPLPEPAAAGSGPDDPAPGNAELAARARDGDALAFELIMRRHNRRLFRLARSLLGNDAEAEDVLQEAYVHAYAGLAALVDGEALGAWLARIVANEALGRLRAASRVVSLEEHRRRSRREEEEEDATVDMIADQPDPERLAASSELRRLLEAAVDALPQELRAVFMLREVEGLSTAETAAYLAIRPETVKTRLHRARRHLQETLGERLLAASPPLFEFQGARCDRIVGQVLTRLEQPMVLDPLHGAGAAEPARPLPRWLSRLLAFLERRRKR
jgi:RNA polymerase sigma-70 factor (ECF subfamily)